jgi:hypothetical protein
MTGRGARIPSVSLQSAAVDFIDNKLPEHHELFKRVRDNTRYDPVAGVYVPVKSVATMSDNSANAPGKISAIPPAKPLPLVGESMKFWVIVFGPAIEKLPKRHPVDEPAKLTQKKEYSCSIRQEKDWDGVYKKLQSAREIHDGTKKGFWGAVKKGTRRARCFLGSNSGPIHTIVKLVPDHEFVSPVLAAIEVLLDVSRVN